MDTIAGVHPVLEALRAGRPLDRILIARGASHFRVREILAAARERGIPVRFEPREALDRAASGAPHQGVVAVGAAHRYADLEEIVEGAELLVALDGVEDPHNLGAIVRTAHAAGASGVIVPARRAAGLTETAAKAASGALEYLPVARVTNLNRALDQLKQRGFRVYGLDERGSEVYCRIEWRQPAVIVLGGEGRGLRQHTRARCDSLVRIPVVGPIASLNVSVAAGIVLFEWKRQRDEQR
ncbi:MAG: 23S rRNA (guanosine(2251)-2'-O)-methyltransferase RlmB [Bryobacterales bacterium]|nr:23S rRNA (guanosine(2251)-2'-O)-methyltransferase RlmB [Bryobacteraceae bacterium]MDW8131232.1 23S rRNA (guanosine(2251)-2'-O)-methyltransferase RlmB [Bryobacterales bacterium]